MSIINLTQHPATPEQIAAGVVDLAPAHRARLLKLLAFDDLPYRDEIVERAYRIGTTYSRVDPSAPEYDRVDGSPPARYQAAMIGGALWLMAPLAETLRGHGVTPVFAFSRRESVETVAADGTVTKIAVFRHAGFVEAVS